jgi:hypothetical protein
VTEVGKIEVIVGTGLFTVKVAAALAADVPPPGAGLVTETANVPAVSVSVAVRPTVIWVLLTMVGVVMSLKLLTLTVEVLTKLLPLIVRVVAPEPAVTELGEREVMAGTGFATEKFTTFDAPPPGAGFVTVTG